MKKQNTQQSKTVNYRDYDQSKYKSWLQQKYVQELLLWDTTKENHKESIENGIKENEND